MKESILRKIAFAGFLIIFTVSLSCSRKTVTNESNSNTIVKSENSEPDYINFVSGSYLAEEKIFASEEKVKYSPSEIVNDKIVKVIQFETLPDNDLKSKMTKDGIELLDYIPNRAFITFLPKEMTYSYLKSIDVSAITSYSPEMKMDMYLSKNEFPDYILDRGRLKNTR